MEHLPDAWTLAWQMIFCMWVQDFFNTLAHYIFHKPRFYKRIHKKHHQYNQTIGISAEYSHPIEFVF